MKLVIDSNVFVSSLDPKDVFHTECVAIFERLLDLEIEAFCPVLVLVEITGVIRRRTNDESLALIVAEELTRLPAIHWVEMTHAAAKRACFLCASTGLKGGDAIVLQVADQYGIPLLTKDAEIAARSPKGILVVDPAELTI